LQCVEGVFGFPRKLLRCAGLFAASAVLSGPVLAEPKLDTRAAPPIERAPAQPVTCPAVAVFPIEGDLECVPPAQVVAPARTFERLPVAADSIERDRGTSASYRDFLGDLVITRDLEVPGVPLGVRLIPSRSALAGRSAPVALIPRFVGTSWYGAEIVASF
jgi:hypothetical protein